MRAIRCTGLFTAVFSIALSLPAVADDVTRTPLPKDHPLVGTWRIDVPRLQCYEIYEIRPDGTTHVSSAKERSESEFQISAEPSSKGFYQWVDKIVKDNGEPDCSGSIMELGHVATNFIIVHPSGDKFLMCEEENLKSCLGPFVRLPDLLRVDSTSKCNAD